ncbi:MAG: hypothetical protein H0W25_05215 [Acidimicrobiia bacterium]|nr:hypothetical protein [Acidimicrobiia bacterium]
MPVARTDPRRTLFVAIAAVVLAAGLIAVVLAANSVRSGGGEDFDTLEVATLLRLQREDPVPVCLNDPATGNRPICVFHTGDVDDDGWVAYDAQVGGCAFEPLSPEATELVDSCTGETYPFTGEGLDQYPTRVEEGRLIIDLIGAGGAITTSTTEEPTTTTTAG